MHYAPYYLKPIPPLEVVADDLKKTGTYWIIASIFGITSTPLMLIIFLSLVLPMPYHGYGYAMYPSGGIELLQMGSISFVFGFAFISVIILALVGSVLWIITYLATAKLEYLDAKLGWGGKLSAVFILISIVAWVFLFLSYVLFFLIEIANIILGFVALIFLVIGFYNLGDSADNSLVKIGGILLIFVPIISGILVGIGLREIGDSFLTIGMSGFDWDSLRDDLNEKLKNGESVFIKYYALSKGINTLLLKLKVSEWIMKGEIKGLLIKDVIVPQT